MQDILAPNVSPDGKYGTQSLEALGDAAVSIKKLAEAVYFDDREINYDDAIDAAILGPQVLTSVRAAVQKAGMVDEEVTDLSENEKARLRDKYGEHLKSPAFNKIFNGLLEVIDGASEIGNEDNPRD